MLDRASGILVNVASEVLAVGFFGFRFDGEAYDSLDADGAIQEVTHNVARAMATKIRVIRARVGQPADAVLKP